MWTIDRVKRELPNVSVRTVKGRPAVTGTLSGRLNRFATVTVENCFRHGSNPPWITLEYTWEAIANSLDTGDPLLM